MFYISCASFGSVFAGKTVVQSVFENCFCGWGLRYSLTGKGKAYNIKGNQGLQLEVNGIKVLIGTQRAEELQRALTEIKKSPSNER